MQQNHAIAVIIIVLFVVITGLSYGIYRLIQAGRAGTTTASGSSQSLADDDDRSWRMPNRKARKPARARVPPAPPPQVEVHRPPPRDGNEGPTGADPPAPPPVPPPVVVRARPTRSRNRSVNPPARLGQRPSSQPVVRQAPRKKRSAHPQPLPPPPPHPPQPQPQPPPPPQPQAQPVVLDPPDRSQSVSPMEADPLAPRPPPPPPPPPVFVPIPIPIPQPQPPPRPIFRPMFQRPQVFRMPPRKRTSRSRPALQPIPAQAVPAPEAMGMDMGHQPHIVEAMPYELHDENLPAELPANPIRRRRVSPGGTSVRHARQRNRPTLMGWFGGQMPPPPPGRPPPNPSRNIWYLGENVPAW